MNPVRREISDIKRFDEIVQTLVSEEASYILDRLNLDHRIPFTKRINREKELPPPERLRKTLEELGTTFIKFGQIMAQRPDVLPRRYTKELQKLEDSVEEFSSEKAREIVDKEIGLENFTEFEEEPVAAASIAQVHRATLENGDDVAVKIRRPGIKEQVKTDLEILQFFADRAEKHSKKMNDMRVKKLTREFSEWTRNELDLEKERRNAEKLDSNIQEERIKIPETYPDLSTEKVFVMEFIEGVKCTETEKLREMDIEAKEISETAVRAGIKQSLRDGFYHADPHPSNFLIQEDSKIAYLDFGMMGQLSQDQRRKVSLLFIHTINEDADAALDIIKDLATIEDDANPEEFKKVLEDKIRLIKESQLKDHSISKEMFDISINASQYGIHMPTSFALMGKSLLTMEGIGLTIYPDFEIKDQYKQEAEKILVKQNKPDLEKTAIDLIQNKDLIEKPFTKLKENSGKQDVNVHVDQQDDKGDEMITASLLLGGFFLISQQDPNLKIVGSAALGAAAYQFLKELN
jgi:ubiquinone biosynthesis protein